MMNFSKREINKGTIRLNVINALLEELIDKPFQMINIIDICQKSNISKVTFFNYFTHKEQLVELYIHMWLYKMTYRINNENSVFKNLRLIFDDIYQTEYGNEIMMTYLQHLSKADKPFPIILSDYEKYMTLEPAYLANMEAKDIFQILQDILRVNHLEHRTSEVLTFFMGVPVSAKLCNVHPEEIYLPYITSLVKEQ